MDSIESNVKSLLIGETLTDENASICDYSLEEQIQELTSKGIESSISSSFQPILQKTVTYIVAAVLYNEDNEVLMMQEAKSRYAGQWYLPAGRVEPNEQLVDAIKREVLEETGLEFEPSTLLLVESSQGNWFRFTYSGQVVGGQLKTVAQADSESLQACWVADINQLSLRAPDCLKLINFVKEYNSNRNVWHKPQFSNIREHHQMLLRMVCVIRRKENNRFHVLVSEKESPHIPLCEINPSRSTHAALKRFMTRIFGERLPEHRPFGVLSVEHNGVPKHEHDGLCLTLLVLCRVPLEEAVPKAGYTWLQVEPELEGLVISKLAKHKSLLLNVI